MRECGFEISVGDNSYHINTRTFVMITMRAAEEPVDSLLHAACREGGFLKIVDVLGQIDEDQILRLAFQSKSSTLLEEVVQYFLVALSQGILSECAFVDRFLALVCKYKLVNTRLEGWATLYLEGKKGGSYVHDVRWEEEAKGASEFTMRSAKSLVGQAAIDPRGKILWADNYTAWFWERPVGELVEANFFELLTERSRKFCAMKCGETFFKANETSKILSYDIMKTFKSEISTELNARAKVLTSQFTRIALVVRGEKVPAVHVKTRLASEKTCLAFHCAHNCRLT
eukprot:TRINITY_DN4600_c0_g1_i2.p1 TRINITY_DN4600_c0_g1~~TRINITY_DN4600_c0_g1_i2.p1  ORF type:complete len:286 (-),score=54.27 TRINITY_DN4600_c0_g1_i2:110-967(-)